MIQILHPIPVSTLKLIAFDLDGTMVDSTLDLCNSVNATLTHIGRKTLPNQVIAGFVGNGVPLLLRRSLAYGDGSEPESVDEKLLTPVLSYFLDYYEQHLLDFTRAYEGAQESLEALHALGRQADGRPIPIAILTNKPELHSKGICKGLGLEKFFVRIYGGDSFKTKKPDPEGLRFLMNEIGVQPHETVMVGDSKGDVQVARNAGAWSVGCAFGFGPQNLMENPPDILVDSAKDWSKVLLPDGI
jgi:phosphoglycolate phosphatase